MYMDTCWFCTQYTPFWSDKVQSVDNASLISLQLFALSSFVFPVDGNNLYIDVWNYMLIYLQIIAYSYGFHDKLLHNQIDNGLTGLYTLSPSLSLVQDFVGVVDRYTFKVGYITI